MTFTRLPKAPQRPRPRPHRAPRDVPTQTIESVNNRISQHPRAPAPRPPALLRGGGARAALSGGGREKLTFPKRVGLTRRGAGRVFLRPKVPEGFEYDANSGWFFCAQSQYYFDATTSIYYQAFAPAPRSPRAQQPRAAGAGRGFSQLGRPGRAGCRARLGAERGAGGGAAAVERQVLSPGRGDRAVRPRPRPRRPAAPPVCACLQRRVLS